MAILVLTLAGTALAQTPDDEAIKAAVDRAYVQGVHKDSDSEKMRGGMHESFIMFVRNDQGVTQLTRDAWIERMASAKKPAADAPKPEIKADIEVLDRTESAAVVKVKLFRDGKQIFANYISRSIASVASGSWSERSSSATESVPHPTLGKG
jgi:hypothetical protein